MRVIIIIIVVIVPGGKQSQPSLLLDGFGLDLDRLWLKFDKNQLTLSIQKKNLRVFNVFVLVGYSTIHHSFRVHEPFLKTGHYCFEICWAGFDDDFSCIF